MCNWNDDDSDNDSIITMIIVMIIVTQAYFGSRVNWIYDPAPPAPRRATLHSGNIPVLASDNQASAIATSVPSGAPLTPSLPRNAGEGEGDRLAEQPIKIERPVQLPQ